jgi:hypothetical protein
MNDIYIARTSNSPEVSFDFSKNTMTMTGEAYPENANDFFHPLLMSLEQYLNAADGKHIEFNFRLTYLNSAATKMIYTMFELLNESARTKNSIVLNWYHDEEDDAIMEFGEGVRDDFRSLDYRAIALELATA